MNFLLLLSITALFMTQFGCGDPHGDDPENSANSVSQKPNDNDTPSSQTPSNEANMGQEAGDDAANEVSPIVKGLDTFVVKRLFFSREESGESMGFNLDEHNSISSDPKGCFNADFIDPNGDTGIDNQFALLLPLIEAAGGEAVEPYAQTAVNTGNMLLFFEVFGLDDHRNDPEVTVRLYRAIGETIVGTDDFLLPWQTFDLDLQAAWFEAEGSLKNGVLHAQNFSFTLPIYIFDFYFEARLKGGQLRIDWGRDGVHQGVMGGAVTLNNILEIADAVEGGSEEAELIHNLGSGFADLMPDENGDCQAVSVTLRFETVGAFLYEDTPRFPEAAAPDY